jgi:S1-C subfamily serine protease
MTESSGWAKWSTVIENIKRGIVVLNSSEGKAQTVMGGATWPSEEPWLIQIIDSTSTPFEPVVLQFDPKTREIQFEATNSKPYWVPRTALFKIDGDGMIVLKQHVVGKPEPIQRPDDGRRLRQFRVGKDRVKPGHRTSG